MASAVCAITYGVGRAKGGCNEQREGAQTEIVVQFADTFSSEKCQKTLLGQDPATGEECYLFLEEKISDGIDAALSLLSTVQAAAKIIKNFRVPRCVIVQCKDGIALKGSSLGLATFVAYAKNVFGELPRNYIFTGFVSSGLQRFAPYMVKIDHFDVKCRYAIGHGHILFAPLDNVKEEPNFRCVHIKKFVTLSPDQRRAYTGVVAVEDPADILLLFKIEH